MTWRATYCRYYSSPDRKTFRKLCTIPRLFWSVTVLVVVITFYSSGAYHSLWRQAHLIHWRGPVYNQLHNLSTSSLSVYVELSDAVDDFYGKGCFRNMSKAASQDQCVLPLGGKCVFQNEHPKADVILKTTRCIDLRYPVRYCPAQILAVMNTEAEVSNPSYDMTVLQSADVHIDHHTSSEITLTEACAIPWKKELYTTPSPSGRKGVALLMSNCNAKWRNDYIQELSKHIHIHSYGRCFHNVNKPPNSVHANFEHLYIAIAQKHRMVLTFENTIEKDYITEKIELCYRSGVIPVYWGPPEIYQWVPGEHSFIDPQKFKGARELAEYLKRVDEDDDLFRYHTTNFNYTLSRQTHSENCINFDESRPIFESYCKQWPCELCRLGQKIKLSRLQEKEPAAAYSAC